MKIKELKELFNQLGSTSSNTDKIAILKGNKDKELFVKTLQFVYDDFIRTGVSFKSLNSKVIDFVAGEIDTDSQGEYSLESLMEYVKEHNTGTHGTIMLIQDFASMFPDEKEFIYHIFAKDIKVGITAKTINKALGKGFIREFSVQLAHPYHKYTEKVTGNEFTLTQKLDGHRSVFIVKNGKGQFYTRKGLPINGLEITVCFVDITFGK